MSFHFRFQGFAFLLLTVFHFAARAQTAPVLPPAFYTTYRYTAYTVYENDSTSLEPPTVVSGVGGTLTLRPTGTYEKRLSIRSPNGLMSFKQDGTFTLHGDSIRFAFTDNKGADVQRGLYRFEPGSRHLTITILGYPTGNKGVYELVKTKPAIPASTSQPKKNPQHRP